MNPDHLSSKLFYEGACGALASGSDTKQNQLIDSEPPNLNVVKTRAFRLLSSFLLAGLVSFQAEANPMNGTVIQGDASFSNDGNHFIIDQGSDRAIINWQDFSIASGETTTFNMPSVSSAVLNRVLGGNLSSIMGTLNANGQVYLINPNGIVVGADGMINTQSFMASTLDVSDARFMEGNDLLFSGDSDATLINMGTITADGGDVFLIARKVSNEGTITATDGAVGMAAGREVLLTRSGDQRLAVRLGGEGSSVDNAGHIQAIQAELKAVGNNPYALAVNNSGLIQADGVEERAGRVYLSATGGTTSVSGSIVASGGDVQVLGDHVQLTGSAQIDASGNEAGTVLIGGDFQGKGDLQTAQTTTIEAGAKISADAHAGDGGRVIVWADGDTNFAGEVSAKGSEGNRGGFVEVSGKQNLKFRGDVDTGGGTLLLDPTNIVIGNGNDDTMTSASLISQLVSNDVLLSTSGDGGEEGNITFNTDVIYGFESADDVGTTYDLTLLAHNNIYFNASVQNKDKSGGDINIVSGWDGVTPFDVTDFDDASLDSTGLFGSDGSVFIGNGNQTTAINVGSRSGATRVYTQNLTLQGSNTHTNANAQLGFKVSDRGAEYIVSGDIDISAKGNIDATAGDQAGSYVQIGHVGKDVGGWDNTTEATVEDADISLRALGDLNFESSAGDGSEDGGTYGSYALLGHGGENASGNFNGNITVEQAGDINFTGGASRHGAYAQLGHVGNERGNFNGSGNIDLVDVGSITFQGGTGYTSYAQLGHGGENAIGDHSGNITIGSAEDITFTAGSNANAYAQLGHGGEDANGTQSGDITINEAGDILFTGGSDGNDAYAQLGHGGRSGPIGRNVSNLSGNITIGQAGDIGFEGGGGRFNYAQLGHGGAELSGDFSGNISLNDVGNVSLTGGDGNNTYAQIGHGSGQSNYNHEFDDAAYGTRQGNITINSRGEITTSSGFFDDAEDDAIDHDTAAVIGHYSSGVSDAEVGNPVTDSNVSITATGWNVDNGISVFGEDISAMLAAAMAGGNVGISLTDSSLRLGNTSALNYDSSNDLTLLVRNDIHFDASLQNSNENGGDINIVAGWDGVTSFDAETFGNANLENTTLFGSGNDGGSVFIGDGSQTAEINVGSRSGSTRVYADSLTLVGSNTNTNANAQLGFKVSDRGAEYIVSGDIDISAKGNIDATAGDQAGSYVQIGHVGKDVGGWDNTTEATVEDADISLRALGDLNFESSAGDGSEDGGTYGSYALLGHGGENASGNFNGNITVEQAGDINFTGGASRHGAYAQLGHVGNERGNFNGSGNIDLVDVGSITFQGGTGYTSYAQLGHGGENAIGDHSGNITIGSAEDITFTAGSNANAYAQLGHGGEDANGTQSGDITINEAGDILFTGGSDGNDAYAQLGHGGRAGPANKGRHVSTLSGDITIGQADDVSFTGGSERFNYAQLGHGGAELSGDFSGNISLNDVGNVSLSGGSGNNTYAQIGHGSGQSNYNHEFDDAAYGTRQGNITINSRGEITTSSGFFDDAEDDAIDHDTAAVIGHYSSGLSDAEVGNPVTDSNVSITATGWNVDNGISVFGEDISAMLAAAMAGGNVGISLTDSSLRLGNTSALNYDSSNDLTLLVRNDIHFDASLQNSNENGGDINIVAGWDGVTSFDAETFGNANLENTTLFGSGNDGGSVFIGDGSQTAEINVGSRSGSTRVYTNNLTLSGSKTASDSNAQLGFRTHDAGEGYKVSGDIDISARGYVEATAGSSRSYVQIGHGGRSDQNDDADGDFSGNISIKNSDYIKFSGGSGDDAYAQLGHGGENSIGNRDGDITIQGASSLWFEGGSNGNTFAQLGHGGEDSQGDLSGDILLTGVGDITLVGRERGDTYAQIGHGSAQDDDSTDSSESNPSGNITIESTGEISTQNGSGNGTAAVIGHRSKSATSISNSNVTITATGWDTDADNPVADNTSTFGEDINDMLEAAMTGGDVSVSLTGSGIQFDEDIEYESSNTLQLRSVNGDISFKPGSSIVNTGDGNIILASRDFHSQNFSPLYTAGGRWLVYSTDPDDNDNNSRGLADFEEFGRSFDSDDNISADLPTGNGFVYEVDPDDGTPDSGTPDDSDSGTSDDSDSGTPADPENPADTNDVSLLQEPLGNPEVGDGDIQISPAFSSPTTFEAENTEAEAENTEVEAENTEVGEDSDEGKLRAACRTQTDDDDNYPDHQDIPVCEPDQKPQGHNDK